MLFISEVADKALDLAVDIPSGLMSREYLAGFPDDMIASAW